jgi:hypothetical protein
MRDPQEPLFLARGSYRRRRLQDAARLLPWFGAFLFALPLLWTDGQTTLGLIYLFCAWIVLIGLTFLLSRRLSGAGEPGEDPGEEPDG